MSETGTAAVGCDRVAALRALVAERPLRFRVVGRSMEPTLVEGETVEIVPVRWPLPGDLVAYLDRGAPVVHRLVAYRLVAGRLGFQTRAEWTGVLDSPLPLDRIIGRVDRGSALGIGRARSFVTGSLLFLRVSLAWLVRRARTHSRAVLETDHL